MAPYGKFRKKKDPNAPDAGNKKVKNAHKFEAEGRKWDSKLEYYLYRLLRENDFDPKIKQKFIIQKSFKFQGKLIHQISWSPDFVISEIKVIADPKGYANEKFPLKFKMFIYKLATWQMEDYQFFFPKSQTECRELVTKLVEMRDAKLKGPINTSLFSGI